MADRIQQAVVRSVSTTDFLLAQNQNVSKNADLVWPLGAASHGKAEGIVREVRVISKENLAWEVQFYSDATYDNAAPDTDGYLGKVTFAAVDGVQNDGAGLFHYVATGLRLNVRDATNKGKLHVKLVNRSAGAKSANAAGALIVEVAVEVS